MPDDTPRSEPDNYLDLDEYALWCELNSCTYCDGIGEDDYGDGSGEVWVCKHCGGTGFEPEADYDAEDYD